MSCFPFTCSTNFRLRHVDFHVMLATSFWWWWMLCLSCACYVTSITLTHDGVCTVAQASSRLFNDLSQVLHLSLAPLVNHNEYMLSWWFVVCCHRVMLSVCSQGRVCTSSLAHTLSHFAEILMTGSPSNNRTFVELHCAVSTLNDHVLLPRIAQSLRLSHRQPALRNPGINRTDYHPKQHRSCLASHFNLRCSQAHQPSLQLVNRRVWLGSELGTHSPKKCEKVVKLAHSFDWRNYIDMPDRHPVFVIVSLKKLRSFSIQSPSQPTNCSHRKLHSFHEQSHSYPASRSAQKLWMMFSSSAGQPPSNCAFFASRLP